MIRRMLAVLHARNLEFVRDRSSLGWNILLPVLLVFGLAFVFPGEEKPLYQVGVLTGGAPLETTAHPFLETKYIDFFAAGSEEKAVWKLEHHRMEMLLDLREPARYWINEDSPQGYILERLLLQADPDGFGRATVTGPRIRYVDWLLPGILGMNMMFSCLFGVGYVVVRYRKSGFLKRLRATPLRALEFIVAQVLSRILLIMVITSFVFFGTTSLLHTPVAGSYFDLFVVATLGAVSMIALGLVVAARVSSEELAGGILNMISWPMMLISGVWFSMEGAHPFMQKAAEALPLTQILEAARAIMLDGAALGDVRAELAVLAVMSAIFLALGAALFKWRLD
ncbi:MAG: ABC transporter permease [Gammaproteobacteria bacterium]